jgi:hypothetical protein
VTTQRRKPSNQTLAISCTKWKRIAAYSLAGVAAMLGVAAIVEQMRLNKLMNDINKFGTKIQGSESDKCDKLQLDASKAAKFRTWFAVGAGVTAIGSGTLLWLSIQPSTGKNTNLANKGPTVSFALAGVF